MSDIVEILRNYIHGENEDDIPVRIAEAADEIELLRQKLAFAEFEWNRATQSWKEAEARTVKKQEWLFNDAEAMVKRAIEAMSTAEPEPNYPNPMRWVSSRGNTFDEMRKAVFEDGLGSIGDAILIWVNEGDFLHLQMNGGASKVEASGLPDDR